MKYIFAVFILGLASLAAQMAESWILYGWLHYLCGSLVTYWITKDYKDKDGKENGYE